MKKLFTVIGLLFSATAFAQNVGIGETNPTAGKLQVKAADSAVLLIQNTASALNTKTALFYKSDNNYSGGIATIQTAPSFYRMGLFTFGGAAASGLKERMSILDDGNVGIGTINPTAKLEVAGTVKIADGSQGTDKVLTSDAAGNASWQSLGSQYGYKKCKQITAAGAGNFTVPAGVTEIMVEAWGAGSGAVRGNIDYSFGGTSGGYVRTVQTVSPGAILNYIVGVGSADDVAGGNVLSGGTTTFNFTSGNIQAFGGAGHASNDNSPGFPRSGTGTVDNYIAIYGNTGGSPSFEFGQKSSTIFTEVVRWGNGGKAVGLIDASIQKGEVNYYENGILKRSYFDGSISPSQYPSCGGASTNLGFYGGGNGMILIWYN